MNHKYISAVFRFQQLLGDFDEYDKNHSNVLPVELQEVFIQQNINHLIEIHVQNKEMKILVCSDSEKFRNVAAKYDFVYMLGGKRQHFNIPKMEKEYVILSFIDYFLICDSEEIHLIIDEIKDGNNVYEMYASGFPWWASRHKNTKYIAKDFTNKHRNIHTYSRG